MSVAVYLSYANQIFQSFIPSLFSSLVAFLESPVPLAFVSLGLFLVAIRVLIELLNI